MACMCLSYQSILTRNLFKLSDETVGPALSIKEFKDLAKEAIEKKTKITNIPILLAEFQVLIFAPVLDYCGATCRN
jgi:hypothetical protein